jgi:hypothetical protein
MLGQPLNHVKRAARKLAAPTAEGSGLLKTRAWVRAAALGLLLGATTAAVAAAAEPLQEARSDFQLALLRYPGGQWNPRPHGLERLAWEIKRRTSIEASLEVASVEATEPSLFDYPLLAWQGDRAFPPFTEAAVLALRQYLVRGGTLLVDISDALAGGPFDTSVRRDLARILPGEKLARIDSEHVVYKSFYLLDRHGGRVETKSYLEGMFVQGRLAVIVSSNDLAGAMARDEFGRWEYDVGVGGESTREMTFRLGVNLVMYALCLDYKDDQVHIPFILQRRR